MRFMVLHLNHEGHQGTRRTCASWFFPAVRFGSLAVQPVCSNHEGHQGTRRTCALWFSPFVYFVSLVVQPSMTSTKVTKGHEGKALYGSSPSCASCPWWLLHRNKQPRRSPRDTKARRFMVLPLRALRVLGGSAFHDFHEGHQGTQRQGALWFSPFVYFVSLVVGYFTATSNHEGRQGTQKKCASFLFPFVRFVSLVVQPSMTSTKVTKGHKGHALHFYAPLPTACCSPSGRHTGQAAIPFNFHPSHTSVRCSTNNSASSG